MPKVSFRMASASRESVFGAQTNTARNLSVRPYREPVDHRAKRVLRTGGNPERDRRESRAMPEFGRPATPVRFQVPQQPPLRCAGLASRDVVFEFSAGRRGVAM